jgi:hypothetical protein
MAKPALILVGADKGGVGKTTVARTLLDYFTAHHVPTRAFDTETPKGTLKQILGSLATSLAWSRVESFFTASGESDLEKFAISFYCRSSRIG